MNVTIAPSASLRRIAEIVRNAMLRGPDAWKAGSLPERNLKPNPSANLLPTDRDVVGLFTLLQERKTPYLLVGGIAMLCYVEGRNAEVIDLLMSLPSLKQLPEIAIEEQNEYFIRGRFRSVRVDVILTANALFAEVQQGFATTHRFAELDVSTATPEGVILLKLCALPSLYRQGLFDCVSVYESDIASLIQRPRPAVEPLLQRLQPTWKREKCMNSGTSCGTSRHVSPGSSNSRSHEQSHPFVLTATVAPSDCSRTGNCSALIEFVIT
jgi:hypothetical protein